MKEKFLSKGQKYVPGIYGGMGPLAHINFENTLLQENFKRGRRMDQEHPVWILVSGSSTPDRTESLKTDHKALNHLIYYSEFLESAGADFIVMTCNTAHAYINKIQEKVSIPIISMPDETAKEIKSKSPITRKNGIMATTGTISEKIYHKALGKNNLQIVAPEKNSSIQNLVMDGIYNKEWGVKATGSVVSQKAKDTLVKALKWYEEQGAEAIILGCTELSVALDQKSTPMEIFDPLKIMANKTLDYAWGKIPLPEIKKI